MSRKRTIDAFFGVPPPKKPRTRNGGEEAEETHTDEYCTHPTYPFPIPHLPPNLSAELARGPTPSAVRVLDDRPDLDLLYFEPYMPRAAAGELFRFLRASLPFYRVEYDIRRGGATGMAGPHHIRTPRWTTVFGVDATSRFTADGRVVDARDSSPAAAPAAADNAGHGPYAKHPPRPIPRCLDELRRSAEAATGCVFNFCLVNYYASGADGIAYHSDDERFLGPQPAITSFSLGATRDFLLKHKPVPATTSAATTAAAAVTVDKPLKLPLASGDMVLMRGATQANWLHSIPKRSGKNEHDGGRINITFRRALVKGGTANYYNYNVGAGPVYRWDAVNREMRKWTPGP